MFEVYRSALPDPKIAVVCFFLVNSSNRARMGLKTALWPWKPCLVFCSPCADSW